jgi:hypothetical protein
LKDRAALAKWIVESLDDLSEAEVETLWAEEAGTLLLSLDEPTESEVERLWLQEAERRLQEFREGKVKGIPSEQVFDRALTDIS